MKLDAEAGVGVALGVVGGQGAVVVAAQGDVLGGVGSVARHSVTADIEGLEGRFQMLVVAAEKTEVGAGHQHERILSVGIDQRGVGARFEAQFPVFYPAVHLLLALGSVLGGQACPIFLAEEACRRGQREVDREERAAAGEHRVVDRVARQVEVQHQSVRRSVLHIVEMIPVLQVIPVVGQRGLEGEPVVGPRQTLSETDGDGEHLEVFVGVVGVFVGVLVIVLGVGVDHSET